MFRKQEHSEQSSSFIFEIGCNPCVCNHWQSVGQQSTVDSATRQFASSIVIVPVHRSRTDCSPGWTPVSKILALFQRGTSFSPPFKVYPAFGGFGLVNGRKVCRQRGKKFRRYTFFTAIHLAHPRQALIVPPLTREYLFYRDHRMRVVVKEAT